MAERGVEVDHATLNRWVVKFAPLLLKAVLRPKAPVGTSSRMDEEPSLLARSRSLRSR